MAIQLVVRVIGISVFAQQGQVTHVLLPASGPAGGHAHGADGGHVPEHVAYLFLGDALDPPDALPGAVPLNNCVLHIRDTGRVSGAPPLPAAPLQMRESVPNGSPLAFKPGVFASPPPPDLLLARVELDLHGAVESSGTARYEFIDGQNVVRRPRRDADSFITWTETIAGGQLEVELELFDAAGGSRRVALRPPGPSEDGAVHLDVLHVPGPELPPAPLPSVEAGVVVDHFELYHALFTGVSAADRWTPRLTDVPQVEASENGRTRRCPVVIMQ